jgi:hypothetical protein
MSTTLRSVAASLVLATAVIGANSVAAQERTTVPYLRYQLSKLSPDQIRAAYTEQSWKQFVAATGGTNPTAWDDDGPPPTVCPPKPTSYCLNSWKVMPVNPFE